MSKLVPCAARCGTQLPKVDEHALGWRPLCEPCRLKQLSWWFDEASWCNGRTAVRKRNENFGKNPQGPGKLALRR